MAERCQDLPEECWDLIFKHLDHHTHLEALSLVCKRFLSITNRLRFKFTVTDQTILIHGTISKLINRFKCLKALDLSKFHGNLDMIILQIAFSSVLNLHSLDISNQKAIPLKGLNILGLNMKSLKVFKCANLCLLRDIDLFSLAETLPFLEELDISYPNNSFDLNGESGEFIVTDTGIEALWSSLRNLRVLNISGNHFITDRSIVGLSLNCSVLREIAILDCSFITQNGILFMLSNNPDLSVISVSGIRVPPFINYYTYGRSLCTLEFSDSVISNEFLHSIAKACIPLKRLLLCRCTKFTFSGISLILSTYQYLEYLALVELHFLTDECMIELSQYLLHLTSIKLNFCSNLSDLTFFTLANKCCSMENIEMRRTSMGKEGCCMEFVKNPRIRSLNLARNSHLSDKCLKIIAAVCPNLELLDISSCCGITEGGIAEILKSCCEIKQLQINDCGGIKNLGTGMKLPKLEVLGAARSGFNDEGLVSICKRCCGLLKLNLEGCVVATSKRVEEIVRYCERLREINLKGCCNVDGFFTVTSMVFSRPSLKKIIPPCNFATTDNQYKLLLSHGCLVRDE